MSFTLPFNIGPGDYTLTAAIHSGIDHLEECYDWADKFLAFKVIPSSAQDSQGIVRLPVAVDYDVSETEFSDPALLLSSLFSDAPGSITPADDSISWMFRLLPLFFSTIESSVGLAA